MSTVKVLLVSKDTALFKVVAKYLEEVSCFDNIDSELTWVTSDAQALEQFDHADIAVIDLDGVSAGISNVAQHDHNLPLIITGSSLPPYYNLLRGGELRLFPKDDFHLENFRAAMRDYSEAPERLWFAA